MKINSMQAPSTLIPEYIGSDFDSVLEVANNIKAVKVVAENIDTFGTPLASETTTGIAAIATQAEVDQKTNDSHIVTPKKLGAYAAPLGHNHATATPTASGFLAATDKQKLDGIAPNANNYTHPSSGVAPGTYKSVAVDKDGHVTSGTNPNTLAGYGIIDAVAASHVGSTGASHGAATTMVAGFMSSTDKTKLDGIAAGANNYTHPVSAVPAGTYKSVTVGVNGHITAGTNPTTLAGYGITDAAASTHVGATGNAHGVASTSAAGFMSAEDKSKLDGITAGANAYVHPTGDGNLHVPATSTTNNGKFLKAGATAGSLAWDTVSKTDIGLSNVDNTSDLNKPISTATANVLSDKAPISHVGSVGEEHHGLASQTLAGFMSPTDKIKLDNVVGTQLVNGVSSVNLRTGDVVLTKADVGLNLVNNTSDLDKPISTATQSALDSKYSPTNKPTAADVGLGLVNNTADLDKPVSTATQAALDTKADTNHAHGIVTTSTAGFMSAVDKVKLDGIPSGGGSVDSVNSKTGDVVLTPADIGVQTVYLSGPTSAYVTQQKTYTITNFDSFGTYAAQVSAGSASMSGDTITLTAPSSAQTVTLTITHNDQPQTFAIEILPASVATPKITSPAAGETGVTETPTITTSAFQAISLSDTHLNSDWELWTGPNRTGAMIASLYASESSLTGWSIPAGVMQVGTTYYPAVLHRGAALGASAWATSSFTTAASFNSYIPTPTATPASFGAPLEGGFYAGMIWGQIAQSSSSKTLATGAQSFTVPNMTGAPIVYAGQLLEVRSRINPANKFIGTVTGASGTTLTLDVTSIGGSGTFSDCSIMARHRVIVAPKAGGENAGIALKNADSAFPTACQTLTEGFAATQSMRNADTSTVYPAAHWARKLNIGGRTDWYIPARDELELCWRNLKPVVDSNYVTVDRPTDQSFNYKCDGSYGDVANTHGTNNNSSPNGAAYTASIPAQTTAAAFRSGGAEAFEFGSAYYWSCSEYSATSAWFQYWYSYNVGRQASYSKMTTRRVRAVRRSVI